MFDTQITHKTGLDYLETVTTLLQRIRQAHPTEGLFEAADLQWWWRMERPTDHMPQLFWTDGAGEPVAGVVMTDWKGRIALDPFVLPGAPVEFVAHMMEEGLAHAVELGLDTVEMEIAKDDDAIRDVLIRHGVTKTEDGLFEAWIDAEERPHVSGLHDGYRLASRGEAAPLPHHMETRSGPDVEMRLAQTSLYRQDLDLVVLDDDDAPAAYGLFWFDPTTRTGLVEPMRTEEQHQRKGLARHIITNGLDRLAHVGAQRIKICFEPDNAGASGLYLDVGFQPVKQTDLYAGTIQIPG